MLMYKGAVHPAMRHIPFALLLAFAFPDAIVAQDEGSAAQEGYYLPVSGRVTDGENKLEGCEVILFKDGERVNAQTTDKSGKFDLELDMNASWGIEFHKDGFVAKRMVFDTHLPKIKADDELIIEPVSMEVGMLERERYQGANTDDLDFPFAMVKWNRTLGTFAQDQEYTMGMQRTNGALLLMAARKEKQ